MKTHSEALKRRRADPDYRARQTETNRCTAEQRRQYFADPLTRALLGQAIRRSRRRNRRKQ